MWQFQIHAQYPFDFFGWQVDPDLLWLSLLSEFSDVFH